MENQHPRAVDLASCRRGTKFQLLLFLPMNVADLGKLLMRNNTSISFSPLL